MLAIPAALAAVWLLAAAVFGLAYRGEVLPGTTMASRGLGGAAAGEARRVVAAFPPVPAVTATFGGRTFRVTPDDVGFRVDIDRSVRRALRAGRGGILRFAAAPAAALGARRTVAPVYTLDRVALRSEVEAIAQSLDRPASNGVLAVDPEMLEVAAGPPRDGRRLDRHHAARTIQRGLRAQSPTPLRLRVRSLEAPPMREVERVADVAEAYLAEAPLRLLGAGPAISLEPARVARLLSVGGQARGLRLDADPKEVASLVTEVATQRDRRARDARISAGAAPVLMADLGSATWRSRRASVRVRRARPGRTIEREAAVRAIIEAIRTGAHEVELPVRETPASVTTTEARKVRDLIGTFTTRFPCCEPRVRNIRLIARAVDGALVMPGQRFSLNDAAGPRTRRRGFVPAPFIADGKIVPSVGGGVSQFSTTMYNAGYFAGLRLDVHQPHSFYISRYPAGREATLDYASIDLVWTNDTAAPVLVRASSTPTSVTVSLYGANGGRRVRASAGPRRSTMGGGFSITVTRTIRYGDGRVVRQAYSTTYDPPPKDD